MNKFVQVSKIKQNNAFKLRTLTNCNHNLRGAVVLNEYGVLPKAANNATSNRISSDLITSKLPQQQILQHREFLSSFKKNTIVKQGLFNRHYATLVGVNFNKLKNFK